MSKKKRISKQKGELVKEIAPEAIEIIEKLPEEQRSVILRSMTIEEYHGPIPPPALLKQYNEIIPNAAERILKMAEGEQSHRHKSVEWMVKSSVIRRIMGLFFGVAIVSAILYESYVLAIANHDTLAGALVTVTIIGLAVIFVLNKEPSPQNKGK